MAESGLVMLCAVVLIQRLSLKVSGEMPVVGSAVADHYSYPVVGFWW